MSQQLHTVGLIAENLGVPVHRVEYVLRTRNIKPAHRAGALRIFTLEQVDRIAEEIESIDTCRELGI